MIRKEIDKRIFSKLLHGTLKDFTKTMKVLQKRVGKISCSKFFFLQISMEVQQALENLSSDLF